MFNLNQKGHETMPRRLLALCFFWILITEPAVLAVTAAESNLDLMIFYSNDVRGEIEPCG